jgi:hypothetical protein
VAQALLPAASALMPTLFGSNILSRPQKRLGISLDTAGTISEPAIRSGLGCEWPSQNTGPRPSDRLILRDEVSFVPGNDHTELPDLAAEPDLIVAGHQQGHSRMVGEAQG